MRSDLEKVPGITDIQTDIPSRVCSFKMEKSMSVDDLKAKLDDFSKTNDHIANWKMLN